MVRRPIQSDFAPDVFVFPGGSVHGSDREAEVAPGVVVPMDTLSPLTALGTGLRVAAIRELFEEAGVILALADGRPVGGDAGLLDRLASYRDPLQAEQITIAEIAAREDIVLATDALTHFAHWITPEIMPKRFTTHFFLVELPLGQSPSHHIAETTGGAWIKPAAALAGYAAGEFPLVFATVHQLRELAAFATPEAAITAWRGRVPPTIMPYVVTRDGEQVILMPDIP